jgi:hypothetical protein
VVETLRKTLQWRQGLHAGTVASQAYIARREGITRARVCQIMSLLRLRPEIREKVLAKGRVVLAVIMAREWAEKSRVIASSRGREELWKRCMGLMCLVLMKRPKRSEGVA